MKTRILPPLYMLTFLGLMWLSHRYFPLAEWVCPPWKTIGWGLMVLGFTLDLFSLGLFINAKTSPNPLKPEKASTLVISGSYRFSRNPMYLGMLVLLTGWAIALGSVGPLIWLPVFVLVLTYLQIIPEEGILLNKFGEDYSAYTQRVRRWL
ncbi:MAG TPA: isoprenylcysteine carboxylmethyltransferase family protein [Gammaproteobacteria bacterium]|nr:isoprenylcysteine carboxylmethyltransferase family protein [Gammaproteobacteria bacterium]